MVKELREATGAGVLDCRKALEASGGDFESAASALREKGLAEVSKRESRVAAEGVVEVYSHLGQRVGVMLELNCETDFVARTEDFQSLAHDLALHIAFAAPRYVSRDQVPDEEIELKKQDYRSQALAEGKPEEIAERIVEGKLEKYLGDICLLEQAFVKDEELSIEELLQHNIARLGENIVVSRLTRYELGEHIKE
jgi:elongation factor Ts